jgi:hypothetical protein
MKSKESLGDIQPHVLVGLFVSINALPLSIGLAIAGGAYPV